MLSYLKTSTTSDFFEHLLMFRKPRVQKQHTVHWTSDNRPAPSVQKVTHNLAKMFLNSTESSTVPQAKKRKKKVRITPMSVSITKRSPPTPPPQSYNNTVDEWLRHRSAHYHQWWKKSAAFTVPAKNLRPWYRQCCAEKDESTNQQTGSTQTITPLTPKSPGSASKKNQRCVLWFQFTGHPSRGKNKRVPSASERQHSIRIEQQPMGGAPALVFAADLKIGEDFALVSRRQPGFTLSLTFYIDGYRDARLSGCCENARNIHIPTRIGGPTGAFVLLTIQGNPRPCAICEKGPTVDPTLFTVRPKSQKPSNIPTHAVRNVPVATQPAKYRPKVADLKQQETEESRDIMEFFALEGDINEDIEDEETLEPVKLEKELPERDKSTSGSEAPSLEAWKDSYDEDSFDPLDSNSQDENVPN